MKGLQVPLPPLIAVALLFGADSVVAPRVWDHRAGMGSGFLGPVTNVIEQQLRLHLPAPLSFVWCVHCLAFHEREWHDRTWQARNQGDRDAIAVYTRPPRNCRNT